MKKDRPTAITFFDQLERADRRPSGFDYLRTALAVTIILFHTPIICGGPPMYDWLLKGPPRPFVFFLVPSFFALSGFLITGSLERNSLPAFFTLRALRIVPALAAEVLISAVIIGGLFTALPLSEYYGSGGFWAYFLNIVGVIHFQLPGVFLDLPLADNVNGQLWTIPYELDCYLVLGLLAVLGVAQRPRLLFASTVAVVLFLSAWPALRGVDAPNYALAPGRMLILTTLFGVCLYKLRRSIPFSTTLFAAALLATGGILAFTNLVYLAALPIAYVTVFVGLLNPPRSRLLSSGDYSYALYLYSFPIQQSLVALFPGPQSWLFNFTAGLALSSVCAFVSWHFLESKVLEARKTVVPLVERGAEWAANRGMANNRFVNGRREAIFTALLLPWWRKGSGRRK